MIFKTIFLLSCVVAIGFSSCEKECPEPPDPPKQTYPIEGLWIGTFKYDPGVSPNQNPQYFSFIIKPGGDLIVESIDAGVKYFARGSWSLNGTTLQCNYVYTNSVMGTTLAQTATSTYDNSGKLVSGKWNNVSNVNEKGTFSMDRIN